MSPVAMSLEELIPSTHVKSYAYSILIRTALVLSTLIVALSIPFFGKFLVHLHLVLFVHELVDQQSNLGLAASLYLISTLSLRDFFTFASGLVMSLIGSLLTMLVVSLS